MHKHGEIAGKTSTFFRSLADLRSELMHGMSFGETHHDCFAIAENERQNIIEIVGES